MQKGFGSLYLVILVAIIIFAAFFAGIKYSDNNANSINKPQVTKIPSESTKRVESKEDLIRRCGDIPDKAYPSYDHYDVRVGPEWAPDCRHIAWSMWESGFGYMVNDSAATKQIENNPRKLSGREGLFLYSDTDKSVVTIYKPKELDDLPKFIKWVDSKNIIFTIKTTEHNYNLITKEISPSV